MLSSVTLDDSTGTPVVLHETDKRFLTHATGLLGIGSLRDSKRPRPQAHGAINETMFEDGKVIVLEGEAWSTVSVEDAHTEFRAMTAAMMQTLDSGPALLKWTVGAAGLALQRLVKLDGPVDPPLEQAAAILAYQAQFFAEDPRAYSQTLTTATGNTLSTASGGLLMPFTFPFTFNPSGGGTVTFTNSGNRPTPPTFRIYGQCINPQILLLGATVDTRIVLNGEVPTGDYIEIGTDPSGRRYVNLSGNTSRANFYDAPNSTWFELPPGVSTIQLLAGSFDTVARLDVLGRSAYV